MRERSLEKCGRGAPPRRGPSAASLLRLLGVSLCASLILAACTDEAGGPQFANEPAPTRAATRGVSNASPAPLPTAPVAATPVALATPASIGDLLRSRGAPSNVYLASGGGVWVISSDEGGNEVFVAPADAEIQALDHSPSGDRVAVLLRESRETQAAFEVVVIGEDGAVISRFDDVPPPTATPGLGDLSSRNVLDWSPQGDRLLVAYANGVTFAVSLEGEGQTEPLALAPEGTSLVNAAWSPTGEAIAFTTTRGAEQERALWVHNVRSGATESVVAADSGRFVVEFAWLPDGMSLLFTEAGDLEGAVSGIDLWRVDADGQDRQLVASAGTVAPVARITEIHPSPDGRSVAYAVLVPGERGPRVDSVWVRDLTSRVGFRIALPNVASVDEIAWTDNGLAIAVTTSGNGQERPPAFALLQVSDDGDVSALWAAPRDDRTAPGTPVATPIGR